MRSARGLRIAWLAAVVAIPIGSLLPDAHAMGIGHQAANFAHVPAYAVLTLLTWAAQDSRTDALLVAVLAASLLGLTLEVVQPWVGRSASFTDYLANEIGVALGAATAALLSRRSGEEGT